MKRLFIIRTLFFALMAGLIFSSCENPLFISASGMYEVTFETNGGNTLSSMHTDSIKTCPVTQKENCDFLGWFTTSDFKDTNITFPYDVNDNITLYAKWNQKYRITFESNGGTSIKEVITAQADVLFTPQKEDCTFAGWFLEADFSGEAVTAPFVPSGETVLYAKWNKNHTVTFNTNGGSEIASIKTGILYELPASEKENYEFAGWFASSSLSGNKIEVPYTVSQDVTLYAKWVSEMYVITYSANGATSGSVPESVLVEKGDSFLVSSNTGNLKKAGLAFTNWCTSPDGKSGQSYAPGYKLTPASNITLYAQWGKDYAAMINVPGGSFYLGNPENSDRPKITLSGFQIAQYELTYELWLEVYRWATKNGYKLTSASKGYAANDAYKSFVPATNISWNMACVWLNAYSQYKDLEPVYYRGSNIWKDDSSTSGTISWDKTKNGYRLPTECEWEFAAGSGSEEEHDKYIYAGINTIGEVAWYYTNTTGDTTVKEFSPVGIKKANKLNLYDMTGNVAEWCYDYYADWGTGELINPIHGVGSYKTIRGGSVYTKSYTAFYDRGYSRYWGEYTSSYSGLQYWRKEELGIRIARNAE